MGQDDSSSSDEEKSVELVAESKKIASNPEATDTDSSIIGEGENPIDDDDEEEFSVKKTSPYHLLGAACFLASIIIGTVFFSWDLSCVLMMSSRNLLCFGQHFGACPQSGIGRRREAS